MPGGLVRLRTPEYALQAELPVPQHHTLPTIRALCYNPAVRETVTAIVAPGAESVKSAKLGEEAALNFCPVCSERLKPLQCKLRCPVCGYYMSCSDYY